MSTRSGSSVSRTRIGAADPGRSAQPREEVAQVVERLGVDEPAERLVDQGDVRFAEQMVDVLGRAQDDPVERQLEQIAPRLDARPSSRRGSARHVGCRVPRRCPSAPRLPIRAINIARNCRSARKKLCLAKRLGRRAEHPVENRVDVLQMIVEVEQRFELVGRQALR